MGIERLVAWDCHSESIGSKRCAEWCEDKAKCPAQIERNMANCANGLPGSDYCGHCGRDLCIRPMCADGRGNGDSPLGEMPFIPAKTSES